MTLPGECINDIKTTCHECGTELIIDVQKSAAGYYIGFWCLKIVVRTAVRAAITAAMRMLRKP